MTDLVEISLLGGVSVRGSGIPATSRAVGLLAYLVLNAGVPQSRSHLAGLFWPDSTEAQARTNLRGELHRLRGMLGEVDVMIAESQTLAWQDIEGCRVDVRTFLTEREAALQAQRDGDSESLIQHSTESVSAYRGPLLPGCYDEWLLAAREDLERQCIDLCDRVVAACSSTGASGPALAMARRRVQLAPLEETGYRNLMELQANAGDRAGAMTTYHRCASVLEQELGVSPSPATETAMQDLVGPPSTAGPVGRAMPVPSHRGTGPSPGLIGRHAELDQLCGRWQRALDGMSELVLVVGEAGVGKSRLVAEVGLRAAREGAVVASARCFGVSGRLALAPVAEWLRNPELRAPIASLDAVWRTEVERLAPPPSIGGASPGGAEDVTPSGALRAGTEAWQRLRFFEGLARAVLAAERPTMLVLDDMQWCDNDTMLWVAFLLDAAEHAPLLVVSTARPDELAGNLDVLAATRSLRSSSRLFDLSLEPLTSQETADVAAQMLGIRLSDGDLAMLQSATGGYPLYVVEAMRNLSGGRAKTGLVADDVEEVLRKRLSHASDTAREVAGLASAVGRDFDLGLVTAASNLGVDAVIRAVDELWRRQILRQSGLGYDFAHDLLRDCAYESVPPARRWLHHRRLAEVIETEHAEDLDPVAAQLAHHHARSGRPDRALPFFARAAEAATKVFSSAEAVQVLRASLDLLATLPNGHERDLQELETLLSLSAPLNALKGYASPELESVLTRAERLAQTLGQARVQITTIVALWACRFVQGDNLEASRLADRALELAVQIPELLGQAHFVMGGSRFSLGAPDVAVGHFELARELSVGAVLMTVGSNLEVLAQAWSAHCRWLMADDDGACRDARQAISRARGLEHPYSLTMALAYGAITHQMAGALEELDDDVAEIGELCRRYDIAYYREWGLVLSGWRMGGTGGIVRMRDGLTHLAAENSFARTPYWLSLLADTAIAQGDLTTARATLDAARVAAVQRNDHWWLPEVLRQSAKLQKPAEATQTLLDAAAMAHKQSSPRLARRCEEDLARLA